MGKKITIFVLGLMTLGLAGASIYVGFKISQEDQAPDDSAAGSLTSGCDLNGQGSGSTLTVKCDPGESSSGKWTVYEGSYENGCPTTSSVVSSENVSVDGNVGDGTASKTSVAPAGKCRQIDYDETGDGGGGTCNCTAPTGGEEPEPPSGDVEYTITKEGLAVCSANGDVVITYTITVTNTSSHSNPIAHVWDYYDSNLQSSYISGTQPNASNVNSERVTWDGVWSLAGNQSRTFKHTVTIPASVAAGLTTVTNRAVARENESLHDVETTEVVTIPDCTTPTHLECVSNSCTEVDGAGANECSSDADCESPTHLACVGQACTEIPGSGLDLCSDDSDCLAPTYNKCINQACAEINGTGVDECDSTSDCVIIPQSSTCIDLFENGLDPISTGAGNIVEYRLTVDLSGGESPNAIRLRVGPSGSPVGRDSKITNSTIVSPSNVITLGANRYIVVFLWEAVSTAGADIAAGTYDVRVLLNGSTAFTNSACQESITINDTVQEEPLFTVIKEAAQVCVAAGSGLTSDQITYTITVINNSPASVSPATISGVTDNYDPRIAVNGWTISNISTGGSDDGKGTISWGGSSFTQRQSKTYSYTLTIPASDLPSNGNQIQVDNTVEVDYSSDTASFSLSTLTECSPTGQLPATALVLDDGGDRLILIIVVLLGLSIIAYVTRVGDSIFSKLNLVWYASDQDAMFERKVLEKSTEKIDTDKESSE